MDNIPAFESVFTRFALNDKVYLSPSQLEVLLFFSHPPIAERVKCSHIFGRTGIK
ncbi:MAG: hypothetical protein OEY49_09440 [Candidatus Heimdallarchaeota archaeon]|nr:hypothetical protein [Candidatus Heimdallarchaeota archaeon]